MLLIRMANFNRYKAIINGSFKSLSIVNIAIAATRLALQYDKGDHRIRYVTLTFWLLVEAAVAVIMASISSYRAIILDYLVERRAQRGVSFQITSLKSHAFWIRPRPRAESVSPTVTNRIPNHDFYQLSGLSKSNVDPICGTPKS